jgi:hypothetical protein
MPGRTEHSFQFSADAISLAAAAEAHYHEQRTLYWQEEMDKAYKRVEATIGAKIQQQQVTGGWRAEVVVDYGDPAAYRRLNEAGGKVQKHREAAGRFRTDERLYATQGDRTYELSVDDVHYYRLGGGPRED